jgi:CheY-like chemotaxis protein
VILLIDDEPREMDAFVRELELSGYQVVIHTSVDSALKYLENNLKSIEIIILDIMMPPGNTFRTSDTESGLRTGIVMYDKIRKIDSEIATIIFTNVSDRLVEERFRHENRCWFLPKKDYLPHELAEEIEKILG